MYMQTYSSSHKTIYVEIQQRKPELTSYKEEMPALVFFLK